MENKSKKIIKGNKATSHGRSKFEYEQSQYIAQKLKNDFISGKKPLLNDIRKLMFRYSKEYVELENKGKSPTKLGTTTIYTFLEKNGIPAPQKACKKFSMPCQPNESSAAETSLKEDINASSIQKNDIQVITSRVEPTYNDVEFEVKKLEDELEQHRKRIVEIEARLKELSDIKKAFVPFEVMIDYSSQSGSSYDHDFLDLELLYKEEAQKKKENKKKKGELTCGGIFVI